MTVDQAVSLGTAVLAAGLIVHLLDRWLYRRRPALDVAGLAQQVAHDAVISAYQQTEMLRAELATVRGELASARGEIAQLRVELAARCAVCPSLRANGSGLIP